MVSNDEKRIREEYPWHIVIMVQAAKKALDEGRARIENGVLIFDAPRDSAGEGQRPKRTLTARDQEL